MIICGGVVFFFFKRKTAYEMRISDRSSDVCSSDLWLDNEVITAVDLSPMHGALDVFGMHEDADGTMWFATDRGPVRWRDVKLAAPGKPEALPVITVFQVINDASDIFWMSSISGVIQLPHHAMDAVMAGQIGMPAGSERGETTG